MSVLVSDSFNRATASTLGTTDSYNGGTSYTWQYAAKGTGTSSFGIGSSGTVAVSENATSDSFAYVDCGQSDNLQIQITISAFATSQDYENGIYFWITDNNNWFRFIGVGTSKLYLQKCVSGTVSSPANWAVTNANGDTLQVQLSGGVVTAYHNGTSLGTYSAGTQTATKHGFGNATGSTASQFDNFQISSTSSSTNVSITSVSASVTNAAGTPSISTDWKVTSVSATSTNSAYSPTIGADNVITSVAATATNTAYAPTISNAANASITAVSASSTSAAGIPSISGAANVTSVSATTTASAGTPSVGSVTSISAVSATSTNQAYAPTISTTSAANVTSVSATSAASAYAPSISIVQPNVNLSASSAASTSTANAPSISANANVSATVANGSSSAFSPTVSTTGGVSITAVAASMSSTATAPVITVVSNMNMTPSAAAAIAAAFSPTISLNSLNIIGHVQIKGSRQLHVAIRGSRQLHVAVKGGIPLAQTGQNVPMYAGESKYIDDVAVDVNADGTTSTVNLSGATVKWVMKPNVYATAILSKDNASLGGVSITDAPNGKFSVQLNPNDTKTLNGSYYHEAKVTDSTGNVSVVSTGTITINPSGA